MKIYTIGFTGKTAEYFFSKLKNSDAKKLIDIRINRISQLAGFAKEQDLEYLLGNLSNLDYQINSDLAPTKELLSRYRREEIDWETYSYEYISLIESRNIIKTLGKEYFSDSVLMCSESTPEFCHRRLFTDLLSKYFNDLEINHLL
jgi:uncharacterized protein (DUF488 family)